MEAEVLRFVRAQDLLPPGSRVTCAVSGGHMENESAKLLGDFFKRLRKRVKQTITEGISE